MIDVSELTDAELNRAMIWLYPPKSSINKDNTVFKTLERFGLLRVDLDYLRDWNLTTPLAAENNLHIQFHNPTVVSSFDMTIEAANKNPLRAICEVLVMIKLEEK